MREPSAAAAEQSHGVDAQRVAFEHSLRDRFASARCLMEVFAAFGVPANMLDVGCGPGHLVKIAHALGVNAFGMDRDASLYDDPAWHDRLLVVDLAQHGYRSPAYDLVLCWEVAEHLPPEAADQLCDLLAGAVVPGGRLVFTAAVPGQGGSGHLNEQPHPYWSLRLKYHGLSFVPKETLILRDRFALVAPSAWWYGRNCMVFSRGAA